MKIFAEADEWFDPGEKVSAMCHHRLGLFWLQGYSGRRQLSQKLYNCAHFWTPGYFRPRIMVEKATTERICEYLDAEIVQSFPLEQNLK